MNIPSDAHQQERVPSIELSSLTDSATLLTARHFPDGVRNTVAVNDDAADARREQVVNPLWMITIAAGILMGALALLAALD